MQSAYLITVARSWDFGNSIRREQLHYAIFVTRLLLKFDIGWQARQITHNIRTWSKARHFTTASNISRNVQTFPEMYYCYHGGILGFYKFYSIIPPSTLIQI